ncbi:MAG: sulfatase-like hydrolase/transferase [Planctomycetota bacterium]|nr:sulfatase-like hydrolase/transferase [Planctomycetota bacterium]
MNPRPNILLITTDQQRWDTLSLHGQPGYRTPVLDGLAANGLCFDRAYCPSPISTPSRVSMLTGRYPSSHGAYTIGSTPEFHDPTLPGELSRHGYRTAIVGKTHFTSRRVEAKHTAGRLHPGLDEADPPESFWRQYDGPYLGFDFVRVGWGHTNERLPSEHYRAWLAARGANLDRFHNNHPVEPPRSPEEGKEVISTGCWSNMPEELHQTAWITEETLGFVERQQAAGRPWFCWTSYKDPHFPFVCPEPFYGAVDMSEVRTHALTPGEFDDKPPFYKRYHESGAWHDGRRDFYDGQSVPACRRNKWVEPRTDMQAYIGMCNMLDAYVGRIARRLERLGALEHTLLVFTSDHGEYFGHHGLWGKGLPAYEDVHRVPCVVHWPAGTRGAKKGRTRALFNLVDLAQTFLEAAGVPAPPGMQGVSQLPVLRGEAARAREDTIVECHATPHVYQQSYVTERHKLVVYRDAPYGELYDLEADPEQMENLWDRPAHAGLRAELMQRFVQANMRKDGTLPPRVWGA